MAIENAGPGGVTNSYGVRTAVRSDIVENGQNALEIKAVKDTSGSLTSLVGDDGQVASVVKFNPATNQPYVLNAAGQVVALGGLVSTWAARPDPALTPGEFLHITDIGIGGSLWRSSGATWNPMSPITLASQTFNNPGFARKTDADTLEAVQWSMVLPGGLLGVDRCLEITPFWSFVGGVTTSKTVRITLGSSAPFSKNRTTSTLETPIVHIINRGAANSQVYPYNGAGTYGSGLAGASTGASVNTSVDQIVSATAQWTVAGTGSGEIRLECIRARLIP
jgi:hypothetical protein